MKTRIKKGDKVVVISGKDKGFTGEVMSVAKEKELITVDGANLMKKHIRSPKKGEKGQRVEMPAPMHISKVMLFCDDCKKGVRVGVKIEADEKEGKDKTAGKKVKQRICKKCKKVI